MRVKLCDKYKIERELKHTFKIGIYISPNILHIIIWRNILIIRLKE